jgi:hypothetical protein
MATFKLKRKMFVLAAMMAGKKTTEAATDLMTGEDSAKKMKFS